MSSRYPLDVEVTCPERVPRWRPLFSWVLVIPLYLWLRVLGFGAMVVSFVGWFAIVFTGRLPESLGDYLVAVLRYRWRVLTYLYGLTDSYPGFRVVAGYVDPGDSPAVLYSARPVSRRRLTVVLRAILIVPQVVVLLFVTLAAYVVLIIGWFAVLLAGRWPPGLQSFVIGWMRWTFRVNGYGSLIVDDYPPFQLESWEGAMPDQPWPPPPPPPSPPAEWPAPDPAGRQAVPPPGLPWTAPAQAFPPEQAGSWSDPAGEWVYSAPVEGWWGPPDPLDTPLEPAATTGPPWPRLVASGGVYTSPRLVRWPIVLGALLFAWWIAGSVAARVGTTSSPPSSAPQYVFTASDAHFTATFPGKPQRSLGAPPAPPRGQVILYRSVLSDHEVGVIYVSVPPSPTDSLDSAVTGFATAFKQGKVLSRTSLTYQGQPAEDGVFSFSGGEGQIRVVAFGSAVYGLIGFGASASSFTNDFTILLDTFRSTSPPATTSPPPTAAAPQTTPSAASPAGAALGSKIIPAPAGFSVLQGAGLQNGSINAAGFDTLYSKGAAAESHYVTGYEINYYNIQGDSLLAALYQFATPTDADSFMTGFTPGSQINVRNDPAIPGAQEYDSTIAETNNTYLHGVSATLGNTVMIVEYATDSATRPLLVDSLAQLQYTRIG